MSFSEAVQWWEEWQLRVLALASLFLQYFLFFAAGLRKRRTPAWFKLVTWLAYMGSDAVAIYGLATLFNRNSNKQQQQPSSSHRGSATLEVLWAPILLMHLGGQDGMTAYNIEDNELWTRHVLTAITQIAVAVYVFRKSFSGEKKLLQAAILVFVPGILKCLEKPWALKSASINSIAKSSGSWLQRLLQLLHAAEENDATAEITSLEEYVQAASSLVVAHHEDEDEDDEPLNFADKPYSLFVDLTHSYSNRLKLLKHMVNNKSRVHGLVRSYLSATFDRLYTKNAVHKGFNYAECSSKSYWGYQVRIVILYLSFAAIPLFHLSNRQAYNTTDVKITYTLLCCTAALEYINTSVRPSIDCVQRGIIGQLPWPDQISQYNLISYLSRNRRHSWLRKLAKLLVCKGYLDQLWCMPPCRSSRGITELVRDHDTDGWRNCINDTVTYRRFNESRGRRTLQRERCGRSRLEWSIRRPFDESVILWHLATDFCFHHMRTTSTMSAESGSYQYRVLAARRRSREMSNYMVYLLFVNTEMLMAGARTKLFRAAYKELKKLAKGATATPPSEEELARNIIQRLRAAGGDGGAGAGLVSDAWSLAQELMGMVNHRRPGGGEDRMWRVIQGVWVEMLCFSASRCRGYLHAKSLGKGGECLSYVWLLLSYMGMETLAETLQRTELHAQGDMGSASAASRTTSVVPPVVSANGGDHNA